MSAADASSLSLWSGFSLVGFWLVIIGVAMEGAEALMWILWWFRRGENLIIWTEIPEPHIPKWAHRLDHIGWFVLLVGLGLELGGHVRVTEITDRESRRLTIELDSTTQQATNAFLLAARIGTTNAWLVQSNLVMQAALNKYKTNNLPMDLGEEASFAASLAPISGVRIELRSISDANAQQTAFVAYSIFALANCPVTNFAFVPEYGQQGIEIGYGVDAQSKTAASILEEELVNRGVPCELVINAIVPTTNTIIVAVCMRPDRLHSELMLLQAEDQVLAGEAKTNAERMSELIAAKFPENSQSLRDAQAEYNRLLARSNQILQEATARSTREQEIHAILSASEHPIAGNNVFGGSFNGDVKILTNMFGKPYSMHDFIINPPLLQ